MAAMVDIILTNIFKICNGCIVFFYIYSLLNSMSAMLFVVVALVVADNNSYLLVLCLPFLSSQRGVCFI